MWTARHLIRNAWRAALVVAPVSCAAAAMFTVSHAASAKGGSEGRRTFETCPEVACKSQEELLAMFGTDPAPRRRRFPTGDGADGGSADSSSAVAAAASSSARSDCPPNREQLGRQAWSFVSFLRWRWHNVISSASWSCVASRWHSLNSCSAFAVILRHPSPGPAATHCRSLLPGPPD